jgi:hypothetical protein
MKDDARLQISEFRFQIGNQSEINLQSEFCNLKSQACGR